MARHVVDEIVSTYDLDTDKYMKGVAQVRAANALLSSDFSKSLDPMIGVGNAAAATLGAAASGVMAFASALVGMTSATMSKAAEFDAMVKALEAIEGSSMKAADAMKDLRKIAELPGLGFGEAIAGYSQLRRADISPEDAKRILQAAGNANALAGGGRAELGQITKAIMQIRMTPNINGQDLMQLTTAGVPSQKILKDAFGTFDSDELKKKGIGGKEAVEELVKAMEKMPKAGNSAKNTIENLQMGIEQAMVSIGLGLGATLIPMAADFGAVLDDLDKNGSFKVFGETMGSVMGQIVGIDSGFESIKEKMLDFGAGVVSATAAFRNLTENIVNYYETEQKARKGLTDWFTQGTKNQGGASANTGPVDNGIDLSPWAEGSRWRDVQEAEERVRKQKAKKEAGKSTADLTAGEDPLKTGVGKEYKDILDEIAGNTKPMKDLRQMILGGGALTGRGISKQEMSNITARHDRHGGDRITRAVRMFSDEIIQSILESQEFSRREA